MGRLWTDKERTLLGLLKRLVPRRNIAELFNYLLDQQSALRSVYPEIRIITLDSQWQAMRIGGDGLKIFHNIERCSDKDLKHQFGKAIDDIKRAATRLGLGKHIFGIQNRTRTAILARTQRLSARKRLRRMPSPVDTVVTEYSTASEETEGINVRPELGRFSYQERQPAEMHRRVNFREQLPFYPLPHPKDGRIDYDWNNQKIRSHPLLLFRATDKISSFRARRFQDASKSIPAPPEFLSSAWQEIALPHLEMCELFPSHFMSFAQNCKDAAHRVEASQSKRIDKKFFLTVFDFNALQHNAEQRWGPESGPYLVSAMFPKGVVSDLPGGYTGSGEWLYYGSIEVEPLAILDSGHITTLLRGLRRLAKGDDTSLPDVIRVLSTIPLLWREEISYRFLSFTCSQSSLSTIGSPAYEEFMESIYQEDLSSNSSSSGKGGINTSRYFSANKPYNIGRKDHYGTESCHEKDIDQRQLELNKHSPHVTNTVKDLNSIARRAVKDGHPIPAERNSTQTLKDSFSSSPQPRDIEPGLHNFNRAPTTPFWSEDSDSGDELEEQTTPTPGMRNPTSLLKSRVRPVPQPQHSASVPETQDNEIDVTDDEWDFVEDDLARSFAAEHPLAAVRAQRFDGLNRSQVQPRRANQTQEEVIQSVEEDQHRSSLEMLSQELLDNAFAPSPTPVLVATPNSEVSRGVPVQAGTQADQAREQGMISRSRYTVSTPENLINLIEEQEDGIDEDFVITGSSRGKRIRIPLRSLSIREDSVIYID